MNGTPNILAPPIHWRGEDGDTLEITYQGQFLKWRELQEPQPQIDPPKRGRVTEFTKASRLRMLSYIAKVDWQANVPCLFITLTYPDSVNIRENYKATQHRSVFWRDLEKGVGHHVPALWRIEWVQRKSGKRKGEYMPHLHVITFREKYISHLDVNKWWRKAIGVKKVRTETKGMVNERQVGYYVAKYSAKVDDHSLVNAAYLNNIPPGRQWGILRKQLIKLHEKRVLRVKPDEQTDKIKAFGLEGFEWLNAAGTGSFTLLGNRAPQIGDIFFGEGILETPPS